MRAVELARRQHNAIARRQLLALGWSHKAIERALAAGRLHRTQWRGVYAMGTPSLTKHGRLRAALLSRGDDAVLSHASAGELWDIWKQRDRLIHLSLPAVRSGRHRDGIRVHRRALASGEITRHWGIPVTSPLRTVIDLAAECDRPAAERLVNAADARNLLRADSLREGLDEHLGEPGVPLLVTLLDEHTFVVTESEIERLFLPLAERAGLGRPESQRRLGRGRVDFWWPELNLVVECDSLRYHRTAEQQREDRRRDHVHLLAGRTYVRFTAHQVMHDPEYVVATLRELRLRAEEPSSRAASSRS
ncbi:MAG TPA: type IV toxin-antitoxin system AbiEi family antitoxin domain-containing protein [Thermoleophilaceae bacterium]